MHAKIRHLVSYNIRKAIFIPSIIAVALFVRLYGINWDQQYKFHPDERFLTMVVDDISIPNSITNYLDPQESTLNPYNGKHNFYVYGTLPTTLNKLIATYFNADNYTESTHYGRFCNALFDVGTLLILMLLTSTYSLGKSDGERTRLVTLSALFYCFSVLPIQLSHFFTVDIPLVFFCYLSLLHAMLFHQRRKLSHLTFSALAFGAGLACKVAALYILPLILAIALSSSWKNWWIRLYLKSLPTHILRFFIFICVAFISVRILDPHLFENPSLLDPTLSTKFKANITSLLHLSSRNTYYPPSVQWIDKTPILFPLINIVFFGLGFPVAIFTLIGFLRVESPLPIKNFLIKGWVICFLLYQSTRIVHTMRYFAILYPLFSLFAALGVEYLVSITAKPSKRGLMRLLFIGLSLVWPFSFMQIYRNTDSRIQLSEWIHEHIPNRAIILVEHWDYAIPVYLKGSRKRFDVREIKVYDPDTDKKWTEMQKQFESSDYLVLSTQRAYGSIMPLTEHYPRMSKWYKDLFAGKTRFTKLKTVKSVPHIPTPFGPITFDDEWGEEAFSVYDHPPVHIFKNSQKK